MERAEEELNLDWAIHALVLKTIVLLLGQIEQWALRETHRLFLSAPISPPFPPSPARCISTLALSTTSTHIPGLRLLSAPTASACAPHSNKPSSSAHSPIPINPTGIPPSSASSPAPSSRWATTNPTGTDKAGTPRKFAIHTYSIVDCVVSPSLMPYFKSTSGRPIGQPAQGVVGVTMIMPGCCFQQWDRCCISSCRSFCARM